MNIMSSSSLRVASDESMPLVLSAAPTATTKPLLTCGNAATIRALRALTATRAGQIGTSDGLSDTPLTCTNALAVSSDASLNHWM
jgi:hypothetical protein